MVTKNVLYIGSGNSAKLIDNIDISDYTIVCANNAWRLFEDSHFDIWIHSGDFPFENRPKNKNFTTEISYKEYGPTAINIANRLGFNTKHPEHYLGYTIFFLGLYWIFDALKPTKVSLLGFDHDYNPEKVNKWQDNNRPTPQNGFFKQKGQSIEEWANSFFKDMKQDSFYGHGTPDPLRLGLEHLKQKMQLALDISRTIDINLVNLSPVTSEINSVIPKESI
jgi:Txe/YoeB family toxin of Txe-Axe toxin-antitoxin module